MPELEPVVGALRDVWDPMARRGARTHVTVLFPFAVPAAVDDALLARVEAVVSRRYAQPIRFASVAEFPDHVLYLEPDPAAPFRDLTYALAAEFPEYPPYGGQFPDVIPHLTVAPDPAAPNDRIRAELAPHLPAAATAGHVELWVEGDDGQWTTRARFAMRGAT